MNLRSNSTAAQFRAASVSEDIAATDVDANLNTGAMAEFETLISGVEQCRGFANLQYWR
jgi:hypothetical protein